LFFLGSLASALSNVIPFLPSELYWLAGIFPVSVSDWNAVASQGPAFEGIARYFGLGAASSGVFCYLLARYGIRAMLAGTKFWRFIVLALVFVLSMVGGFRSLLILLALTFAFVFYFEGLLRTKYAAIFASMLILGFIALVPLANRLPLSIQRTLSILPLNVDPVARYEAEGSSEWRVDMWKLLLPDVPKYFFKPKGMGMDAFDLELTTELVHRGQARSQDLAILAGDYHNGPLSILIPFGIWGFVGWLWFLVAAIRALWLNHRYGPEYLRRVNVLLLAYFVANVVQFFVVFGGFYIQLIEFVSIVGLSLSLNNGIRKPLIQKIAPEPNLSPVDAGSAILRSA
jgi:O-antigen ligase